MLLPILLLATMNTPCPRIVVNLNQDWEFVKMPGQPSQWDSGDLLNRSAWKVVSADSEETARENGLAKNAIDGNPKTHWHTEWSAKQPGYPHTIVIDLGSTTVASGLVLLPRQGGPRNGLPKTVQAWLGDDKEHGTPVGRFILGQSFDAQRFEFIGSAKGRFLKLQFEEGQNQNEPFICLSEIGLVSAARQAKTDWQSQYNIAYVQLGDDRFDLKQAQLEELKRQELEGASALRWEKATLPHTANVEKLGVFQPWQGICFYKRTIDVPKEWQSKVVTLTLEGAMSVSSLWLNGAYVGGRRGGYLPVVIDLSKHLKEGANELVVRLDNRDNPLVPPGKPTPDLDFLYWSGIYRDAYLTVTPRIHITDPILADQKASGGVYAFCPNVTSDKATVEVRTHVVNEADEDQALKVVQELYLGKKLIVATEQTLDLRKGEAKQTAQQMVVDKPSLWSPDQPTLYCLITSIQRGTEKLDEQTTRIGIRHFEFSRTKGFVLNGKPTRLIGTNRHQEYPYIGNALSNNAGYRDMKKIKDAGFNCVRLSHYPMDPAVMDACDELGLLVIPCIAGWQFYNSDRRFTERVNQDIRDLIRRDRNHPCCMAWETSLNETYPPADIVAGWYKIAHEEFLAPDMEAVGDGARNAKWDWPYNSWTEHDKGRPQNDIPDKPGYIREYGDYEFGGGESTTRQPLSAGERGNLQSAWNFVWSHNRNRGQWPWTMGDGTWVMYDYHRGYDDRVEYSGMANVFRLPRYIQRFFQIQYRPEPAVFICSDWTPREGRTKVVVFSNGDEVELYLNGKLVKRQKPDSGPDTLYGDYQKGGLPWDGGNCRNLVHPPFTFFDVPYQQGELKAVAYKAGKVAAEHVVRTPGKPVALRLRIDESGRKLQADGADCVFVYADAVDEKGTICTRYNGETKLTVEGAIKVIGPSKMRFENGTASFLIQSSGRTARSILIANCSKLPVKMAEIALSR